MNLDDFSTFSRLDPSNMLAQIDDLPEQLQAAWELGQTLPIPDRVGLRQVILAGMGGSAIGGDLLAAYAAPYLKVPVLVHRDYGLPAWAKGQKTLVIVSSHSGNTEEALSALETAQANSCRCMAVTRGGALAQAAQESGILTWKFRHDGQPRAAVGYSFGLLLAILARLKLLPDQNKALNRAVLYMRKQQDTLRAETPAARNPAKRIAGQLVGRFVTVIGAGLLAPVARRWKTQINEIAKASAQFEILPEANHNMLAGVVNPVGHLDRWTVLFLRSSSDHPRNRLRGELTQKILTQKKLMGKGLNADFIDASGKGPLSHMWTSLQLGDYVSYYMAMAYDVDPTPVEAIESLKREMKAAG